jgi:hypothetical protein
MFRWHVHRTQLEDDANQYELVAIDPFGQLAYPLGELP